MYFSRYGYIDILSADLYQPYPEVQSSLGFSLYEYWPVFVLYSFACQIKTCWVSSENNIKFSPILKK